MDHSQRSVSPYEPPPVPEPSTPKSRSNDDQYQFRFIEKVLMAAGIVGCAVLGGLNRQLFRESFGSVAGDVIGVLSGLLAGGIFLVTFGAHCRSRKSSTSGRSP